MPSWLKVTLYIFSLFLGRVFKSFPSKVQSFTVSSVLLEAIVLLSGLKLTLVTRLTMPCERRFEFLSLQVPSPDGFVITASRNHLTIWAKTDAIDRQAEYAL